MTEQKEDIRYCIVAEDRNSKKRIMITAPLSKEDADNWQPLSSVKKFFRYFKVAKYPYKGKSKRT